MHLWSDTAWAMGQAPGSGGESGSMISALFPFVLMFGVLYFLILRPQKKQAEKHKQFLASLEKGVEVTTTGGICGKIVGVADNVITLEIASNVKIKVLKSHIAGTLAAPSGTATPTLSAAAEK